MKSYLSIVIHYFLIVAQLFLLYSKLSNSNVAIVEAMTLDIHLKPSMSHTGTSCLYKTAISANQKLHEHFKTEQINFNHTIPHITLYLTEFQDDSNHDKNIVNKITETIRQLNLHKLEVSSSSNNIAVNGSYAMLEIQLDEEGMLQYISDTIVNHTMEYIMSNQPIPTWIYDLPEPERSRKIDYVQKYGSPNVFDEFEPHLTVGYDEIASIEERKDILKDFNADCIDDVIFEIGVGTVGDFGTVVNELVIINLESNQKVTPRHSVLDEGTSFYMDHIKSNVPRTGTVTIEEQ